MGEREKPCRTPMTRRRMKGIVIDDFEAMIAKTRLCIQFSVGFQCPGNGLHSTIFHIRYPTTDTLMDVEGGKTLRSFISLDARSKR